MSTPKTKNRTNIQEVAYLTITDLNRHNFQRPNTFSCKFEHLRIMKKTWGVSKKYHVSGVMFKQEAFYFKDFLKSFSCWAFWIQCETSDWYKASLKISSQLSAKSHLLWDSRRHFVTHPQGFFSSNWLVGNHKQMRGKTSLRFWRKSSFLWLHTCRFTMTWLYRQ